MADVGIVMPVYKQKTRFLQAALRSILKQNYRSYKLIIVIDGTTANVVQTVRRMTRRDTRVKVISYRVNKGTCHALNTGFAQLTNDPDIQYLTWVSSDNIYLPNYISTLRMSLVNAPSHVGFVYSNSYMINNSGKSIHSPSRLKLVRQWRGQPIDQLIDTCFIGASFMYRKSVAIEVGEYRYTPIEDYDYWLRITERCGTIYLPMELMKYRVRSTFSMSRKLATSTKFNQHRKYISQLIRMEARKRRQQLGTETTIIFTNSATPNQPDRLNSILTQSHYNLKCIVIDQTPALELHSAVTSLPDLRVQYVSMPYASDQEVFVQARNLTQSPYVMFYSSQDPLPSDYLLMELNSAALQLHAESEQPLFNHLYSSERLFETMVNRLYPEAV
ncbi:glycosyltransferase family 2 protein [Paenibacillus harenae]|uniref:glycosyltransferase family 2 protein n=1 Tax=Paenibacillus harenae TaxID=306543 RepID=UPI0027919AC8|nr:glycosyltransferase family A protein [Paenibacillus harenae]MDQ0058848.1 GT2 family glycosyltransferase [Paenibacillus harenae]